MFSQNQTASGQQQSFNAPQAKRGQLTVKDFEYIVAERKSGRGCKDIADELNRSGYTSKGGGRLWACDVSQFCIRHGYRVNKAFKRMTKKKMQAAQVTSMPMAPKISLPFVPRESIFDKLPAKPSETVNFPNMAEKYNQEFSERNSAATEMAVAENFIANVVMPNHSLTNLQKTKIASALLR